MPASWRGCIKHPHSFFQTPKLRRPPGQRLVVSRAHHVTCLLSHTSSVFSCPQAPIPKMLKKIQMLGVVVYLCNPSSTPSGGEGRMHRRSPRSSYVENCLKMPKVYCQGNSVGELSCAKHRMTPRSPISCLLCALAHTCTHSLQGLTCMCTTHTHINAFFQTFLKLNQYH